MDDIADILSSLSSDDIDMLKGVADSILGGSKSEAQPKKESNPLAGLGMNIGPDEISMIMKVKSAFEKMNSNSQNSDNANLILALKPHLSQARQDKADEALRMMKLMDMLPLIKDLF